MQTDVVTKSLVTPTTMEVSVENEDVEFARRLDCYQGKNNANNIV